MIALRDVTVRIGGVHALAALTVDLSSPVHGVVGPNGAGKTTLLNAVSGIVRPAAGAILLDGEPIQHLSARQRARAGVGRTFQTERLAPSLSAWANVAVAADHLLARGERHAAITQVLAFVGIERPATPAGELDGFQRKLLEIGRALVGRPRILLLDEPAGGLTSSETLHLAEILSAITETFGAQVVLVDHDVDLIAQVCQRTAVLDFGALLAEGETGPVLDDDLVRTAWLGPLEEAAHGHA
jgi:branched-chain amino acid transport system ATP-binding protein